MTSTTENAISVAPARTPAVPAPTPPPAAPAPAGLWMLTILIGAFFVLVGVCFWMGTQIR